MRILFDELSREPPPPRQWIGTEAWVTHPGSLRYTFCAGAIGFAIQQAVIPGLKEFLEDVSVTEETTSAVLTQFWEEAFKCRMGNCERADDFVNIDDVHYWVLALVLLTILLRGFPYEKYSSWFEIRQIYIGMSSDKHVRWTEGESH